MNKLDTYNKVFTEIFGVDEGCLGEAFTFANTEAWDSLTHLSLIAALEEAFEVFFETDDILNFGGYTNGIKILTRYGVDFAQD